MRFLIFFAALMSANAMAEVGDITCIAKQFTVTDKGMKDEVEKKLDVEMKAGSAVRLSIDIGDRYFVLAGDNATGDYLLTQAWGEGYRHGINATGSFTSSGRMQISLVEETRVFKLECNKVMANAFPRE